MGTKLNPGLYDCYGKADPEEPLFTLRGKDPASPYLVMLWVKSRQGKVGDMLEILHAMMADFDVRARVSTDIYDKLEEALQCAFSMRDWRKRREGVL